MKLSRETRLGVQVFLSRYASILREELISMSSFLHACQDEESFDRQVEKIKIKFKDYRRLRAIEKLFDKEVGFFDKDEDEN